MLVAHPQLRLAGAKIVVQRLPAQGLPEQRAKPPAGVTQGLLGIGQAGLLHRSRLHPLGARGAHHRPGAGHPPPAQAHARRQHRQHHHHHQQGRALLLPATHPCLPLSPNKDASQHARCCR
ncbi:hypothetical protein PPS11_16261 [Pseudomonas putida S11]|nr:hypothetical protein PPS11_16261 [Pseudomonas putida S11]